MGNGAFGTVFKVERRSDKRIFIMKKISESQACRNEIEMLKKLEHPNILKRVEDFYEGGFCLIITEFCGGR